MAELDAVEALRSAASNPIVGCFSRGAVLVFDHDLRFISAGGFGLAEFALTAAAVEGKTLADVFPPAVVAEFGPRFRGALAGDDSALDVHLAGKVHAVKVVPVRDGEGRIVAGVVFTHDATDERRAEEAVRERAHALSEERRRLHDAQVFGRVGSWELDIRTRAVTWSETLFELYGADPSALGGDWAAAVSMIHLDDRPAFEAAVSTSIATGTPFRVRYRVVRANDGGLRWFDARGAGLCAGGELVRVGGSVTDVTEQVLAEARAAADAAFQSAVMKASPDIVFVYDISTDATIWTNRPVASLFGDAGEGGRDPIASLMAEDDRAELEGAPVGDTGTDEVAVVESDHLVRQGDGTFRWLSRRTTPLERSGGRKVTQLVGVLRDVTDAVAARERLEHGTMHDELTGLANRRLVADRLSRELDRPEREGRVAVVICDLDGFKRVNDAHGHPSGDAVLVETATRLVAAVRSGDTVGRISGDEFVVISGAGPGEDATDLGEKVTRRIEAAMAQPITVDGIEHRVTISSGICIASQGDSAEAVLRNADTAMYLAKSRGKNGHAVFEPGYDLDVAAADATERLIRRALWENTLEVYYQPVVEPATGRVRGTEALLRVPDGNGRHLDTLQAVAVAERTALISEVDDRVLRLACTQVAAWRRHPEHAGLTLAVNRSAAEISRPGFTERISAAIADTGLDPAALTIEITETVLLDVARHAIADLRYLRAEGIGIAIDDFGTGYASLRYLATLPITCLKVDRSFTSGIPGDPTSTTILRATAGLAADLHIDCVVEGVETITQANALPHNPRLFAQGYLYARPQPPATPLPAHLGQALPAAHRSGR